MRRTLTPEASVEVGEYSRATVLPLGNLSGDFSQDYLAEGMIDEFDHSPGADQRIACDLPHVGDDLQECPKSLPEIARGLNVDAVAEGSVSRSGERVRITAQLMWAQSYGEQLPKRKR
jgi:TolB-like protein